jgi:hypothetical protein
MKFINWANNKVKRLNYSDVALTKLTCLVLGILLVVLIPALAQINIWLLVIVAILLAIKPTYSVFKK